MTILVEEIQEMVKMVEIQEMEIQEMGDGGDGDGGDTGVASCDDDTGVCTCSSGKVSTIPSANPCATECPKSCGGTAAVVRDRLRNRRRTGNQAKRVFYSKMISNTERYYDTSIMRAGIARISM